METKTYNIQGRTFTMRPVTLEVKKHGIRLLARLRRLIYEYTTDTDFSLLEKYYERKNELTTAKSQLQKLIGSNTDEHGYELAEGKRHKYESRINEYEVKLEGLDEDFKNDANALHLAKLKNELESFALLELLSETELIKAILGRLLEGGNVNGIDFTSEEAQQFTAQVMSDFFCLMSGSALK